MNDVFMGVAAVAVLVMAIAQVAVAIIAVRMAKQVSQTTTKLERDIRPIVAHLQTITTNAAAATTLAAAQVERADKLFGDLAARVEQTSSSVQAMVAGAGGGPWLAGIMAAVTALRSGRRQRAPVASRPTPADGEDALFIG